MSITFKRLSEQWQNLLQNNKVFHDLVQALIDSIDRQLITQEHVTLTHSSDTGLRCINDIFHEELPDIPTPIQPKLIFNILQEIYIFEGLECKLKARNELRLTISRQQLLRQLSPKLLDILSKKPMIFDVGQKLAQQIEQEVLKEGSSITTLDNLDKDYIAKAIDDTLETCQGIILYASEAMRIRGYSTSPSIGDSQWVVKKEPE